MPASCRPLSVASPVGGCLVDLAHEFTGAIEHPASGFHPRLLLGPSRESDPGPAHGLTQILAGSPEFFEFVIADPRKQQTGAEIHLPSACVWRRASRRVSRSAKAPSWMPSPARRCFQRLRGRPRQEDDEEALVAGSHDRVSIAISQLSRNDDDGPCA